MRRHPYLVQCLFATSKRALEVASEEGLERLLFLPLEMLGRQCLDAVERPGDGENILPEAESTLLDLWSIQIGLWSYSREMVVECILKPYAAFGWTCQEPSPSKKTPQKCPVEHLGD
jgi:hypothetical protein